MDSQTKWQKAGVAISTVSSIITIFVFIFGMNLPDVFPRIFPQPEPSISESADEKRDSNEIKQVNLDGIEYFVDTVSEKLNSFIFIFYALFYVFLFVYIIYIFYKAWDFYTGIVLCVLLFNQFLGIAGLFGNITFTITMFTYGLIVISELAITIMLISFLTHKKGYLILFRNFIVTLVLFAHIIYIFSMYTKIFDGEQLLESIAAHINFQLFVANIAIILMSIRTKMNRVLKIALGVMSVLFMFFALAFLSTL